jgi:hypothetical protein
MMRAMEKNRVRSQPERRYPSLYERVIPIALVFIVVSIIALMMTVILVVMRMAPGAV